MKKVYKTLCAILLAMSMVSTTVVFAEEATPTPTPTPTASIEVMEGEEEASTPTEEIASSYSEQATDFINHVNEAETNRDNILIAAQEYVDAYVASFDAEGEEATAEADALIVEKEDTFFGLFDQGALLDAYDALSEDEKNNEDVINAKTLLDALIADVDAIMNVEEPSDDPATYLTGVTPHTGAPTEVNLSTITGHVEIKPDGIYVGGVKEPGEAGVNPDGYEFTGTTSSYGIRVDRTVTDQVNLILNNVTLSNSNYTAANTAMGLTGNDQILDCIEVSHVDSTITLVGTNNVTSNVALVNAIVKNGLDGSLEITGTGKLNAIGTVHHSGAIGSNVWKRDSDATGRELGFANLTISGGEIYAQAGGHNTAIGVACSTPTSYPATNIVITGSNTVVEAHGGELCAGLGGGAGAYLDGLTITGGAKVTAYGGRLSPGIGVGGLPGAKSAYDYLYNRPIYDNPICGVTNINISGGETIVTAYGDLASNSPGIGPGQFGDHIFGPITDVYANPDLPAWATYIKYGTSATNYNFTTTADENGAGQSLATPISADREFATFLLDKRVNGINVYYTQVYFGLPHDEFASTNKADIGANNYSTCAGSFTWTNIAAAKTDLLHLASVSGHDQDGNVLSEATILANIAANATTQAAFDAQVQAIFNANANHATGNYLLTFTFEYIDSGDNSHQTMAVSTHIQFRDACSPTVGGSTPSIGASNAIHPTGGVAFTKAQLIGLTEGTASNFLGLDADLVNDITFTQSEVDAINNAKTAGQTGTFPLTYTYVTTSDGTAPLTLTKTVTVTLTDVGFPFDPTNPTHPEKGQNMGPQFGGNNHISKTGGSAFTPDQIKLVTGVSAKDSNGTSIPLTDITPDPTQLATINAAKTAGQVGDFPLKYTFTDVGGTVRTITVTVSLRDEGVDGATKMPTTTVRKDPTDSTSPIIRYETSGPQLGSNDYTTLTGGTGWTADEIKDLLDVVGKDSHGATIARTDFTVDPADLNLLNTHKQQGLCGRYPVKFTGPNGETITSYVTLAGCPVPPSPPGPFLITYLDCNGNTVKVEWVPYGGSSTKPSGNYPSITNVTAHQEVKPNNCTVSSYHVVNTGVQDDTWIYILLGCGAVVGIILVYNKSRKS